MARHKTDSATRRLLDAMPETRADLTVVVDALVARGVKRRELAAAAGWNQGYLSDFLSRGEKKPLRPKLVALIEALQTLAGSRGVDASAAVALQRVVDRYELPMRRLQNPASDPIAASAPNFVPMAIETALERAVATPGTYAIDGQPMSGVSTALLLAESKLAERGMRTCRLSARIDLMESKRIERSRKSGVLGALAAAITGSNELLEQDHFVAQDEIDEWLAAEPAGFALLLDDVNDLPLENLETLKNVMRDWATRRAAFKPGYANVTMWLAFTSNVREVTVRSQLLAEYMITGPFERGQVKALAEALVPFMLPPARNGWARDAAQAAFAHFAGQPHLTHLFLWDRHHDGSVDVGDLLRAPPLGAYERHLVRLARTFVGLLGARADVVAAQLEQSGSMADASIGERQAIERLGVVNPDGSWSCPYYAAHLPTAIRATLSKPR